MSVRRNTSQSLGVSIRGQLCVSRSIGADHPDVRMFTYGGIEDPAICRPGDTVSVVFTTGNLLRATFIFAGRDHPNLRRLVRLHGHKCPGVGGQSETTGAISIQIVCDSSRLAAGI